jgi:hypothetical protein
MQAVHFVIIGVMLIGGAVAIRGALEPREPTIVFKVEGERAYVFGTTDSYSGFVVRDLVRENPQVTTLILQAMPGTEDMTTNTRIARDIRNAGLATHVPADGRIASGAVDWLAAGVTRTIDCGAMVGVHSWGNAVGGRGDQTFYDPQALMQRDFLDDMGVDPGFYRFTKDAAGPDDIYWMTPAEMVRFDLLSEDPGCETP